MAQDISEENSKEMAPTLKVGMKNIHSSLRSVDFAWNKFYMVVGQATNNVIATLYLSVIHIDTSNYLPSRRVLRPPMADPPEAGRTRFCPDSVGTDRSNNGSYRDIIEFRSHPFLK
jgi:hypothetical protein